MTDPCERWDLDDAADDGILADRYRDLMLDRELGI